MAVSSTHNGWRWDPANSRLDMYYRGTRVGHLDACGISSALSQTVTCGLTVSSGGLTVSAGVTTASGGLVVTGTTTLGACAVAYTWPAADGSCGQQLTTDGCAALSWAAASTMQFKTDLGDVCRGFALDTVRNTPVHRFRYDPEKLPAAQWGCTKHEMTGIFAEEAPWAMQGKNKQAFSPMNSFGMLTAAVQELSNKVDALEEKLS